MRLIILIKHNIIIKHHKVENLSQKFVKPAKPVGETPSNQLHTPNSLMLQRRTPWNLGMLLEYQVSIRTPLYEFCCTYSRHFCKCHQGLDYPFSSLKPLWRKGTSEGLRCFDYRVVTSGEITMHRKRSTCVGAQYPRGLWACADAQERSMEANCGSDLCIKHGYCVRQVEINSHQVLIQLTRSSFLTSRPQYVWSNGKSFGNSTMDEAGDGHPFR